MFKTLKKMWNTSDTLKFGATMTLCAVVSWSTFIAWGYYLGKKETDTIDKTTALKLCEEAKLTCKKNQDLLENLKDKMIEHRNTLRNAVLLLETNKETTDNLDQIWGCQLEEFEKQISCSDTENFQ